MAAQTFGPLAVAVTASLVTFLLTAIWQIIKSWRRNVGQLQDARISWYRQVIGISREAWMDAHSGVEVLKAYDELKPDSDEEAIRMIKQRIKDGRIELENASIDEGSEEEILDEIEGDYDSLLEFMRDAVKEHLEEDARMAQVQEDLRNQYVELKGHWSSVEFEVPSKTQKQIDEFLQVLFVNSLFSGISDDSAKEIQDEAKQLIAECKKDINTIESIRTKRGIKKKF